jgi:hypothetical protein
LFNDIFFRHKALVFLTVTGLIFFGLTSFAAPSPVTVKTASGDRMKPTIAECGVVIVDRTATPAKGDIAAYENERSASDTVLHRVVAVDRKQ